jgi:hypothetical protein
MVMDSIEKPEQLVKELTKSPRVMSHLAVRHDGAILVSLEDAPDCDLRGREVVSCLVLTQEEAAGVRHAVEEGAYSAAARLLGALPKLPKGSGDAS